MKTQCPFCQTPYDIAAEILRPTQGLARCFRCGRVFNAFDHCSDDISAPARHPKPRSTPADTPGALQLQVSDSSLLAADAPRAASTGPSDGARHTAMQREEAIPRASERPLPFEIPDDLEELEATEEAIPDAPAPLAPTMPPRSPWWQKTLAILLLLALGAQLAWIRRDLWIHHPMAIQACALLDCRLTEYVRPQDFHVIERDMQLVPGNPPMLRLWLRMRNDGPRAQPLPLLELTLLDATGAPVARKTFPPETYLPKEWIGPDTALPGEEITIELPLQDPGPRARGFVIEFRSRP
ncbi:MAG: DUF3426 domain-containing protein [Gammaproteobacteria bacterium]|nr:MAG: DUF3426 domain-containing protein [Gammaproteobacteria bacterium]